MRISVIVPAVLRSCSASDKLAVDSLVLLVCGLSLIVLLRKGKSVCKLFPIKDL